MPRFTLISSSGLSLEAREDPPEISPPQTGPAVAVICHPHPVHGGTMDNKVVFTLARALRRCGLHVVRFNFRGAGASEGRHDHGKGEQQDVLAALDHAAGLLPEEPAPGSGPGRVLMVGFSFGSWVGSCVGVEDARVGAHLVVAPPVNHYDYAPLAGSKKPLAVVYARDDELVPAAALEAWLEGCASSTLVTAASGGGHLFHTRLAVLDQAVNQFLDLLTST